MLYSECSGIANWSNRKLASPLLSSSPLFPNFQHGCDPPLQHYSDLDWRDCVQRRAQRGLERQPVQLLRGRQPLAVIYRRRPSHHLLQNAPRPSTYFFFASGGGGRYFFEAQPGNLSFCPPLSPSCVRAIHEPFWSVFPPLSPGGRWRAASTFTRARRWSPRASFALARTSLPT